MVRVCIYSYVVCSLIFTAHIIQAVLCIQTFGAASILEGLACLKGETLSNIYTTENKDIQKTLKVGFVQCHKIKNYKLTGVILHS